MDKRSTQLLCCLSAILIAVLACNAPGDQSERAGIEETQTALAVQGQDQQQEMEATEQEEPDLPPATETSSPQLDPSLTPSDTPEPTIEHLTSPGEPTDIHTWISDLSSEAFAPENRTIGDSLIVNLLERPFTAEEMAYQPYLDIIKTEIGEGGEWIYVNIILEGEPPEDVEAAYAVEIDVDRDGRGDWLIQALVPASSEWTTDGVQVWRDSNADVGGSKPMRAEAPLGGVDGYDQIVFDAGHGDDPDAAWVRRGPASPNQVHLAFKHTLIEAATTFLWGSWSDEGVQEPGWFDYNDHFTLEEAGSPLINNDHYPLAALFSVDNTCRWTYGFEPTTVYPGLCPLPTAIPTATRVPPTQETGTCPTPPPDGCPTIYYGSTSVQYEWNPVTCECEAPACSPPEGGCPVTAPYVWNPETCQCELQNP